MKKELLITILAVIAIIGISVLLKYVIFKNYLIKYSTEPMMQCVQCNNSATWNNQPCCDSVFSEQCAEKNGIIRFRDLRPDFSGLLQLCYMSAPDTGKECALESDCLSGFCDLGSAIGTNKCVLRAKKATTTTYSCFTDRPGRCASAPENTPSEASYDLEMQGRNLIMTQK